MTPPKSSYFIPLEGEKKRKKERGLRILRALQLFLSPEKRKKGEEGPQ